MIRTSLRLTPAAVVAMVLVASACTRPPSPPTGGANPVGTYRVTQYMNAGDGLSQPIAGTTITLQISAGGQLSGRVCNSYNASSNIAGTTIDVKAIVSTKMYCGSPVGLMDQESDYFAALASATTWRATDAGLTLSHPRGTAVVADRVG